MPRRLILMRHAKSSWKDHGLTDHQRPLNKRGRTSAPRVAERLREIGWLPELVCSSDSTRTRETWALLAEGLPEPGDVRFTRRLYLADLQALREEATDWAPEIGTVIALGHNPGWEDAVSWLTGRPSHMATGNAALLESDAATWHEALGGPMRLVELIRPREM